MLTFGYFQLTNDCRANKWHTSPMGIQSWSLSDWGVALGGEVGELLNVIKKLNRNRDEIRGNSETGEELAQALKDELADVITYAFLLASAAGIDVEDCVASKFNRVSDKHGFTERV